MVWLDREPNSRSPSHGAHATLTWPPCPAFVSCLEDLCCLSWISLNSLDFTIRRRQLVNRKPEPTLLPAQGIVNLTHGIDMVWEQLVFDDAVSYTQWWKSKLAEFMAWGIKSPTFRLGADFEKKSDTLSTPPQSTPQVISGKVPNCHGMHSWWVHRAAQLRDEATSTMAWYPIQTHYPDTEQKVLALPKRNAKCLARKQQNIFSKSLICLKQCLDLSGQIQRSTTNERLTHKSIDIYVE